MEMDASSSLIVWNPKIVQEFVCQGAVKLVVGEVGIDSDDGKREPYLHRSKMQCLSDEEHLQVGLLVETQLLQIHFDSRFTFR